MQNNTQVGQNSWQLKQREIRSKIAETRYSRLWKTDDTIQTFRFVIMREISTKTLVPLQ